jgi:lipoprotein-anchoring transpeptidase ErfK/SrfK
MKSNLSRREFLKFSALGLGSLVVRPWEGYRTAQTFPQSEYLGRVAVGKLDVMARPDADSQVVGTLYEDAIIAWMREVIGPMPYRPNQRWVETPDGYIWLPYLQPVRNQKNEPVAKLPITSLGSGMWAEVTVPYVNLGFSNPPARAPWLVNRLASGLPPRFFYNQIAWVNQIYIDDAGAVWYQIEERFGHGDNLWVPAETMRPLTEEEVSPISPDVDDKRILVDVTNQTLSCYEGSTEVYFCRISSGALYDFQGSRVDAWSTPLGKHRIWRKAVSLPLSGGSAAIGWDLPAVGWITLFVGSGVAIHSTYWHNNYGVPTSQGCVNARPEDAKWIFRWTQPLVAYDPGDVTVSMPGGTMIEVIES